MRIILFGKNPGVVILYMVTLDQCILLVMSAGINLFSSYPAAHILGE